MLTVFLLIDLEDPMTHDNVIDLIYFTFINCNKNAFRADAALRV